MDYANELQLCYDEMLESFGQFEVSANERIKAFEEKLVNAVNYAKVIQWVVGLDYNCIIIIVSMMTLCMLCRKFELILIKIGFL